MPRCGCPFTVGRKPSVTKGKKTEPDTRTTVQVLWEHFCEAERNHIHSVWYRHTNIEIG